MFTVTSVLPAHLLSFHNLSVGVTARPRLQVAGGHVVGAAVPYFNGPRTLGPGSGERLQGRVRMQT